MKKKKLAIFDVDGTIFRKNLHFELLQELVYLKIFDKEVRSELVRLYGNWLNHEGTYEEYRDKLVELYEMHIRGCNQKDIVFASEKVVGFNAKRTYIFSSRLIEKLRKGHILLIISGSPIEIVKEFAKALKFDAYYGSVYEVDENSIYTGRTVFEPTKDKGAVVKQFMTDHNLKLEGSVGIGDTESDASFLEMVDEPIAFNPNTNLKGIAEKRNWKVVVEKKDVIYEIWQG